MVPMGLASKPGVVPVWYVTEVCLRVWSESSCSWNNDSYYCLCLSKAGKEQHAGDFGAILLFFLFFARLAGFDSEDGDQKRTQVRVCEWLIIFGHRVFYRRGGGWNPTQIQYSGDVSYVANAKRT